jgi:hypothetical protein
MSNAIGSMRQLYNKETYIREEKKSQPHPKGNVILSYIKIELGTSNLQPDSWKLWNQIKMNKQMYTSADNNILAIPIRSKPAHFDRSERVKMCRKFLR